MPHDFDADHHFTAAQQAQYDSLSAAGRTLYDQRRWYDHDTHEKAYDKAVQVHGKKSPELLELEMNLAMIQAGLDPRITW